MLVFVQEAHALETRSLSDLLYTCAELQSPEPAYGPLPSAARSANTSPRVRFGFLFLGLAPDDLEPSLRASLEYASFELPSPQQLLENVLERVLLGPLLGAGDTSASGKDSTTVTPNTVKANTAPLLLSPSLLLFLRHSSPRLAHSIHFNKHSRCIRVYSYTVHCTLYRVLYITLECSTSKLVHIKCIPLWLLYVHFVLRDSALCAACLDLN